MFTPRVRSLLFATLLAVAAPAGVSAGGFPIAALPGEDESSQSIAFDGTNFLVAIQGGGQRAQLVSPSGALLASATVPGASGDPPLAAFDGTNYLLVWADTNTLVNPGIHGQRVSTAGSLVGMPFRISDPASDVNQLEGVAFDGTNYLVVWTNNQPVGLDVIGRFVTPGGATFAPEFDIDGGPVSTGRDPRVAFGGGNYFVAWTTGPSDNHVYGRFISPAGDMGTPIFVNLSAEASDNPGAVAFDGTNFLVVFTDYMGDPRGYDFFGQLVSQAGVPVGAVIPIATGPGLQLLPYVAYDGAGNYLVIWTDLANDANSNFLCEDGEGTCADIYGQRVSTAGALVGTNFGVEVDAGNQGQSPVAYGAGKYLAAWTRNFESSGDVYGTFLFDDAALDYFTLAPCRVVDTRGGAPIGGPVLQGQETRTFAVSGHCAIPATARALSINLAVAQSTAAGNLRLFPAGQSVPTVSAINYKAGQTRGNNAIISLSPTGMSVFVGQAAGTTVHLILDVNGYFE